MSKQLKEIPCSLIGRLNIVNTAIIPKLIYRLKTIPMRIMEKEMATHSSILAWRIPGMGEPGGLQSMGSQRVGHDGSDLAHKHVRIPVGFFVEIDESERVSHSVVSDSLPSSGL